MEEPGASLSLWDYRRRVADLYCAVRNGPPAEATWRKWRQERDTLFATHPQSALDAAAREVFGGLSYFPYDPTWRVEAEVVAAEAREVPLAHSGDGATRFRRFATAYLEVQARSVRLDLYWLAGYGGGVFLPFRDATSGTATYGGGRYLLDTAKGADLGHTGTRVVLDFNYAYHPSCVYSERWSCPLAPPKNQLPVAITAGERLPEPPPGP